MFPCSSHRNNPRHKSHKGRSITASVPISILDSDKIPRKEEFRGENGFISDCNPRLQSTVVDKQALQELQTVGPITSTVKISEKRMHTQPPSSLFGLSWNLYLHSSGCRAWGRVLPTVGCIFSY